MTKPVWFNVLALCLWTLKKAHNSQLPQNFNPDYKYLHARQIPHKLSFSSKTIPDCIRYFIGVFCYNFKSQPTFMLHINTLAFVKAEI